MRKRTYEKDAVIHIGPKITVTVLYTKSGVVRLGIEAPEELAIHDDKGVDDDSQDTIESN